MVWHQAHDKKLHYHKNKYLLGFKQKKVGHVSVETVGLNETA